MTRAAHLFEVVARQAEEADRLGRTASSNSARGNLVTIAGAAHTIALLADTFVLSLAGDDLDEALDTIETFVRVNVDALAREIEEQQTIVHEERANRQAPATRCPALTFEVRCDLALDHSGQHVNRRVAAAWS